ncbi:MAG: hypothetical protein Kow002_20630 [Anaerolineales bacterium]
MSAQLPGGGWGYHVDSPQAFPEPTCYSLLALADRDFARERALAWLGSLVDPQGRLFLPADDSPNWATAHLLILLTRLNILPDLREASIRWLLAWKSEYTESIEEVVLDATLVGWPWISDTFSWVQPTSYAALALKMAGLGAHARVQEAERLLLDRVCPGGGWNFGNPIVLDQPLDPSLVETAITLLALQNHPADKAEIADGLRVLEDGLPQIPSSLALSLGILCLLVYDRPVGRHVASLLSRQDEDGSWGRMNWWTALAVLALQAAEGDWHVFRL